MRYLVRVRKWEQVAVASWLGVSAFVNGVKLGQTDTSGSIMGGGGGVSTGLFGLGMELNV